MKYIVVAELSTGGVFCVGIYNNYITALGKIMTDIFEEKAQYADEGDSYKFTDPYEMEGDGGDCIEATYKSKHWEEPCTDRYFILFADIGENGDDIG